MTLLPFTLGGVWILSSNGYWHETARGGSTRCRLILDPVKTSATQPTLPEESEVKFCKGCENARRREAEWAKTDVRLAQRLRAESNNP